MASCAVNFVVQEGSWIRASLVDPVRPRGRDTERAGPPWKGGPAGSRWKGGAGLKRALRGLDWLIPPHPPLPPTPPPVLLGEKGPQREEAVL